MRFGEGTIGRLVTLGMAVAILASACTGSTTVEDRPVADGPTEPSVESERETPEPDRPTSEPDEPTAVPAVPTPAPTATPLAGVPAEFRSDSILTISDGGRYAYAGTTSPWNTQTPCEAEPQESLAVVDIEAGVAGDVMAVGAGLEQTGDIVRMLVGTDGAAVVLSSCGPAEASTAWIQSILLTDGRVASVGPRLDIEQAAQAFAPYLVGWVDDETVELEVLVEADPDDSSSWLWERRHINVVTGAIESVGTFSSFDEDAFAASPASVRLGDVIYRVIDDPDGSLGCEGFGVARTLELDDGANRRLALTQPGLVFSTVDDLHSSPDGYVAWTSGCEGYVSAFVGRLLPDGRIADAHLLDTFGSENGNFVDYRAFRLTDDGFLAAVGQEFEPDSDVAVPVFLRHDLSEDPHFVNTAQPALDIDPTPLFEAVGGDGTWHVGESLGEPGACGARTLYGQTEGGFVRAFPSGTEIDPIVDVDLAETRRIDYEDGSSFVSRTVVVQTECPAEYEGRRVWFGLETDRIIWGLYLDQADLGEVADVLSVRDVLEPGTDFLEFTVVEVELLDGSVVEAELTRLPFDS